MSGVNDRAIALTEEFYAWEFRGRGWDTWPYRVPVEPPFRPFLAHGVHLGPPSTDDGRKHTPLSMFVKTLRNAVSGRRRADVLPAYEALEEPTPDEPPEPEPYTELLLLAPSDLSLRDGENESLLLSIASATTSPVAFEIIGDGTEVSVQLGCPAADVSQVTSHVEGFAPGISVLPASSPLSSRWETAGPYCAILDFGLSNEFLLPLATRHAVDPLLPIVSFLETLEPEELGIFQILVQGTNAPWAASMVRAAGDGAGGSFFSDAPEMLSLVREKTGSPLLACVIRVAASAPDEDRARHIAFGIGRTLRHLDRPGSNELIPLSSETYPLASHEEDLLDRTSHRTGMVLSCAEVASLARVPSRSLRSPKLARLRGATKRAPEISRGHELVLGENQVSGQTNQVALSDEQRTKHIYVIGASGTGKSTFLLNLIAQDLEAGRGIALLDPHGDLVDDVLSRIPSDRVDDVLLFDPSDTDHPVPFNILEAHSETEKNLLASDLGGIFRRLSTTWGDQMTAVLGNAILAFLEGPGGTLIDLRRFLSDDAARRECLSSVTDPEVVSYWQNEFPRLSGKPQVSVLTRLNAFLRPRVVRNIVSHRENRIDFAEIMDSGKIFLAKLSEGLLGEENAHLLGSLLVAKFHQVAIARQEISREERRPFFLYVDEFQHFVTPSMTSILSGARKYGLGLVLAHQELAQLAKASDIGSSALTNAYTRVCFRLGDADARRLADGFSTFSTSDLSSLGTGQAIARVEQSSFDFNLTTSPAPSVDPEVAQARREEVVARSRDRYSVAAPIPEVAIPLPDKPTARTPTRSAPAASRPTSPAPRPQESAGRGGREHKYLQQLVSKLGVDRGLRATVEKELSGGGRVDVALEGPVSIACEISISTSAGHETENIKKCLAAGFEQVVVVSPEKRHLTRVKKRAAEALEPEHFDRVSFIQAEEIVGFLDRLTACHEPVDTEVRGYRVRVKGQAAGDADARKQALARVVADSIRRLRDQGD